MQALRRGGCRDVQWQTEPLAVVVQRMVEAVSAGVLFTADPVIGRRGKR